MTTEQIESTERRSAATVALPGFWRATAARSVVELRGFFRNRQSLVFTLLFPVMLLLILGSIFSGEVPGTHTDFKQVFIAGIVAAGVMSTAFSGLAINLAIERDSGLVRRLALTPMPKSAYFAGKLVKVVLTSLLETVILLVVAVSFFHLRLPAHAVQWFTMLWVLSLGTIACALCAVAYSWVIPNGRSAAAIVTPPFLVVQFISGIFYPFHLLPDWMQSLASFFPLKWMAQGLRSVFLPAEFAAVERAHSFEIPRTALVLACWCLGALVLSLMTFRWRDPRTD
jgi:ABC-2 type transport system permease protein